MGDCGSMFIGFLLASSVMLGQTGGRSRSVLTILAVPVLILFVPIFDTTLVTVIRKLWGRKASTGGRDHTSHRLVALGLSERSAVLMIYGFAAAAGVLAVVVNSLETAQSFALIAIFTIMLSFVGVYLSKVKVYDERQEDLASQNNAVFAFLIDLSYKRRIFEVILDVFLITLAYYFRVCCCARSDRWNPELGTFHFHFAADHHDQANGISRCRGLSRDLAVHKRFRSDHVCKGCSAGFDVQFTRDTFALSISKFFASRLCN